MSDNAAKMAYSEWKSLRRKTEDHRLCECAACSKRRKLGAKLDLPYTGEPKVIRFRDDDE